MDMKTLGIGLLALSLSLSACKKSGESTEGEETESTESTETTEEVEKPAEPEAEPEKPAEPEVAAEDAAADVAVAAAPVDESLFIKAYYEVTCVQTKVDDMGKQKEIIAEILPRYGFEQGSFDAAKTQLDGKENIKLALTERMKSCTKEVAMAFVAAGGQVEAADMAPDMVEDMAEDMAKPKPVKPQPAYVGKLYARGLAAGDIVQTELMLNIQKDFLVLGSFKGLRDGKRFTISLRGNVDKSGSMVLNGTMGQNRIGLRGNLNKSGATGSIDGQIYGKAVNARFNAPK
jgi:hypothetical protein